MKFIKVKTQFEGFHKWEKAPKEVKFLRNLHRHMFGVVVSIQVRESDRELEYFMVLKNVNKIIQKLLKEYNQTESCEVMAEYILDYVEAKYRGRIIQVEVNEDGENGSIIDNYQNSNE